MGGEVVIEGRLQTGRHLRRCRLTSSPRCFPTTTTSRNQQRSLPYRLLPDTRRVLWIDRHLQRTHNRQGLTDKPLTQTGNRLCAISRQDRILETQTLTPENTVFTLAEYL